MGQLSRELYLTVREYSLGLSKKANLEKTAAHESEQQVFTRSGGWKQQETVCFP